MTNLFTWSLTVLLLLFIGCGSSADNVPPKIILGQDACDNCYMIINEIKYAAAVTLQSGEEKRFDDIGCMLSYVSRNKDRIKYYWVDDFNSYEIFNAENAFFIRSKNEVTPMGSGIIAFSGKEKAESFAEKENTSVMNFDDLIKNN